jgi:uncharacterized lipoprotein
MRATTTTHRVLTLALLAAITMTTGCNWLRADRTNYQGAKETRPLEVPPGLDTPSSKSELTIPTPAKSASSTAAIDATPPSGSVSAPASAPTPVAQTYVGTETTLLLGDEIGSAFRRVSLALERSGVMTVVSKDESAGTVTLKQDTVTREGGFFKKITGRAGTKTESVTRVVRMAPEGAGTRVKVQDEAGRDIEDESARQIIAAVKQRLG